MTEWDKLLAPPLPDSKAAIDFLAKYSPENPVVLTAIAVGKNPKIYGIVINPGEFKIDGRVFVEKHNGKANIYFSVNPPKVGLNIKKAKKQDLSLLRYLHIDLDPMDAKPLPAERKRILGQLKGFFPEPTLIIDSGGGYQGFWKLNDPQILKSEKEIENLEGYNIELVDKLGGDACHNLDRIMRLPGTINVPTPQKIKKGRKEALAKIVQFNENLSYDLTDFTKSVAASPPAKDRPRLEIKGDINIDSDTLDVLPISERVKELIIHGEDPEEKDRWPSRSECLFHVVCRLIREEQSYEVIYSIITNPEFKISESVLDAPCPKEYAEKQIGRAKNDVERREDEKLSKLTTEQRKSINKMDRKLRMKILMLPPDQLEVLLELNGKHCVIKEAGKVRILNEEYDTVLKRNSITRSTFEDLRNFYSNRFVDCKNAKEESVMRKLGKWWLDQGLRRQYGKLLFLPQPPGSLIENDPEVYNLFRGYSVEPRETGDWSLFNQHMLENICDNNVEHYDYLIGWMANTVQYPARPGQVAIVLKGEKGTGKSKFAKVFGNLFGQHFLHVGNPKHLTGNFNQHLRDAVVVFADEAIWAGDKQGESVLKMLVTEETLIIEGKGIDPVCCPNFVHLLLASNHDWVVPAGNQERRYFILNVSNSKAQDGKFFGALSAQMNSGGNEALLYFLWKYDLSKFDLRKIPFSEALENQQALSLTSHQSWWEHKLREGRLLYNHAGWKKDISKRDLYSDYILAMKDQGIAHRLSKIAFQNFLKSMLESSEDFANTKQIKTKKGDRPYVYTFPDLIVCRVLYEKYTRRKYVWDEILEQKNNEDAEMF